ncbi:DoxX family protein [Streptomyces sp. KR80]|uniref:DoxX family protein n=1 Tax=Streptomyces sp. KR80 TaxID=3457426 RepID=UPI003FD034D0
MDILVLIGRILFGALFLTSGANHLVNRTAMAGYAASRGLPAPLPATLGSGVLLIASALSVLLGIWADLGSLLLAAFLLSTAALMHAFWKETDAQSKQAEMTQFLKDLALCGASLMLLAFFSYAGDDLGLTLTCPLFDID